MSARLVARAALGALGALAAAATLVAASRYAVAVHAEPDAMLRLAWSARPERIERCRTLDERELAELPAHMRQRVVCTGETARYRVEVLRDGRLLRSEVIRGGGLRHDRQLYHFRELRVPAGPSLIEVRVSRLDSTATSARGALAGAAGEAPAPGAAAELDRRELEARERLRADEMPASLVLREAVMLVPREVMLVSYDRLAHRLRTVRRPRAATASGSAR